MKELLSILITVCACVQVQRHRQFLKAYHFLEGGWDSYLTTPFSQEGALEFSGVETGTF